MNPHEAKAREAKARSWVDWIVTAVHTLHGRLTIDEWRSTCRWFKQIPPDGLARMATVVGTPTPSAITRQQILARLADRAMQEVYSPIELRYCTPHASSSGRWLPFPCQSRRMRWRHKCGSGPWVHSTP